MKGETKTTEQLEEVEKATAAAIVAEMHSPFYLEVLGQDLGISDTEALERRVREILPRSIVEAVEAAKKDKAAPTNVRQPDPAEFSDGKKTKKTEVPGATEEILGGQAA